MATNALYLVCDMINDLVHADGPSKKTYGPELARRKAVENTATAIAKARAAGAKIGYVRVGFSPDYRECPPNSRLFQGAKKAGMFKLGTIEPIQVRVDGPDFIWEGAIFALGIGNGRQAGGGHVLCPDALLNDGQCDLTVVPELSGEVAAVFGTWLADGKGAALEQAAVRSRMPWLRIEAPEPLTLNLDGEPVASRRFRIECVPRRVRAHLPQDCPLLST